MKLFTYKEQINYIEAFKKRFISLLIFQGRGGTGKSYNVERLLEGENYIMFKGHSTPLSIYQRCLKNPNALVVFDDVDALLNNKTAVALLKQLCDTKEEKKVYYSTTSKLDGEEIPKEFISRNKVLLLCNSYIGTNDDLKAVLTRGFYFHFEPTNEEVFKALSKFATDKQLLKEFEKNLYKIPNFNFRLYEKALQLKEAKLDYNLYLRETYNLSTDEDVLRDVEKLPREEGLKIWRNKTGLSERSFYRKLKEHKRLKNE